MVTDSPAGPRSTLAIPGASACIHCGLCLSACPTYLETGNENDSPRGRIYLMRALQSGRLDISDASVRHLDLCLGCRACEAACPSGVPYGELIEEVRSHIEQNHKRSFFQTFLRRILIEQVFPFSWRMKLALWPARLIKRAEVEHLLPRFARETLALIPDHFEDVPSVEFSPATTSPRQGRVGFISGCVMSVMFGRTNANSVRLLNHSGYDVVTPAAQGCCGALHAHGGNLAAARLRARHNIRVFENLELDAIVINAAGCGSTLKEYGHLLQGDPEWEARGRRFSAKVKDLTEWLVDSPKFHSAALAGHEPCSRRGDEADQKYGMTHEVRLLTSAATFARFTSSGEASESKPLSPSKDAKVTFHDACHLAHAQRITSPPRQLVRSVAGSRFVELPESDVCCGSAGSYNLTEPGMATQLQTRKTDKILSTGATVVVTTNPGCLLQIQAGLSKAGASHIRVLHIADFLAENLGQE